MAFRHHGAVRSLAALVLGLLLTAAIVAASLTWWLSRTILDDEAFVSTVTAPLDTPAVDRLIADRVADRAAVELDGQPEAQAAIGVALGIGPQAGIIEIRTTLAARVLEVLARPSVRAARDDAVRTVHRDLVSAFQGQSAGGGVDDGTLTIDLSVMAAEAMAELDPSGRLAAVVELPRDELTFTVRSGALATAQSASAALIDAGIALPILALAAGILLLLVVTDRRQGLTWIGVALVIAGVLGVVVVFVSPSIAVAGIEPGPIREAASAALGGLLGAFRTQSAVLAMFGFIVVAAALALGMIRSMRR